MAVEVKCCGSTTELDPRKFHNELLLFSYALNLHCVEVIYRITLSTQPHFHIQNGPKRIITAANNKSKVERNLLSRAP